MAEKHMARHKRKDASGETDEETAKRFEKRQKKQNREIEKLSGFIENMEKKEGKRGQEIQSNVTDNESAIIPRPSGYIQGYIGVAVSDKKEQIIISAQAFGSANEDEHFKEMLEQSGENIKRTAGEEKWGEKEKTFLADKNYFSEGNLKACEEQGIEAVIPDSQYKRRLGPGKEKRYEAEDFIYDKEEDYYECTNGKKLPCKGTDNLDDGEVKYYRASLADCRACLVYSKCIQSKKEQSKPDKGKNLVIRESNGHGSLCRQMRRKLETEKYQEIYARRIQIIEPVFANISYGKPVTRIENMACISANISSVTIPNSVTYIGGNAFANCARLTSVTIQGTISSSNFFEAFDGDLRAKYLAGGAGTYTRTLTGTTWTKQ
jgi:hypothetical protein